MDVQQGVDMCEAMPLTSGSSVLLEEQKHALCAISDIALRSV